MTTVAVIDFETTGLSLVTGGCAIELAIIILGGGNVVDCYQSLTNTGVPIPSLTSLSKLESFVFPPQPVVL